MDSLAADMILVKRYSYPEDVVGRPSFLASSESDYMTGQLIMIGGGMPLGAKRCQQARVPLFRR